MNNHTRVCPTCETVYGNGELYCPQEGSKLLIRSDKIFKVMQGVIKPEYQQLDDPTRWWEITGCGDEEGRSTIHYGIHQGTVEELAFRFAENACYNNVCFTPAQKPNPLEEVNISFGLDSLFYREYLSIGYSGDKEDYTSLIARFMPKANVRQSNYYNSVKLLAKKENSDK